MNFDAIPPPEPDEHEAIARAVEELIGGSAVPEPYRSRWLAAALRENTTRWSASEGAPAVGKPPRPRR